MVLAEGLPFLSAFLDSDGLIHTKDWPCLGEKGRLKIAYSGLHHSGIGRALLYGEMGKGPSRASA